MTEQVLVNANSKMQKTIEVLKRELVTIRTGRATPALVDHIKIDNYGTPTPLNQVATISVPEARVLLIEPWDKTVMSAIEKAILKSDLGLNPVNTGNLLRLVIPQLTEERRRELVKVVSKKVEENKIALRNVRRDTVEELKASEKDKAISKDELKRATEQLQKLTDKFVLEADIIKKDKEVELMES